MKLEQITKNPYVLLLAAAVSGCSSVFIIKAWPKVIFDHPQDYMDLLLIVIPCAVGLVVMGLALVILTSLYNVNKLRKSGQAWILPIWYLLRAVGVCAFVSGMAFGIASGIYFLGRNTSPTRFSSGTWHFGLFLSSYLVIAFTLQLCGVKGRNKLQQYLLLEVEPIFGRRKSRRR